MRALGARLVLGAGVLCHLACAPAQSLRPALPPGRDAEVGVALARVGPRPYVVERARPLAQGWYTRRAGERWLSSIIVGFDHAALLAGAALRFQPWQGPLSAALEAEAGFAWAALSVPLAWQPSELVGVYCSPRLGNWGPELTGFVPCGLSAALGRGVVLRAELQLSWADFVYYNRRVSTGFGLAQQW